MSSMLMENIKLLCSVSIVMLTAASDVGLNNIVNKRSILWGQNRWRTCVAFLHQATKENMKKLFNYINTSHETEHLNSFYPAVGRDGRQNH